MFRIKYRGQGGPGWSVFQGDAIEVMQNLVEGSVDCIITDPPYESIEKHRAVGSTTRLKHSAKSSNDWFTVFPNERFLPFLIQCWRVMKPNSHLYIFCDDETSDVLRPIVDKMKFKWWKRLVWDKMKIGMGYHWRCQYEFIVFLEKGKRRLNDLRQRDVLRYARIHRGYPAEKPVGLCEALVLNSTKPGQVVLDPFCGSSTTGIAALNNERDYIGIDTSGQAIKTSIQRITGLRDAQRSVDLQRL